MPDESPQLPDDRPQRQIVVAAPLPALAANASRMPSRQLSELPTDELQHLAEDLGVDPTRFKARQLLVAAIHDRRQLISGMEREAMLDVVRWGRRPVTINAAKEQIAQEISRIHSMKFAGLSQRGLLALARLRGIDALDADPVPVLVHKLRKQEGIFAKLNRKRRALLGGIVAGIVGENETSTDYQFLPPEPSAGDSAPPPPPASIKQEIEDAGLFAGISNRIKKTADQYLNQKLDDIEARIDRKLDEIDRRLAEWRDKEIANRIRILKITLWASVIVGVVSLLYEYVTVYILHSR